MRPAHKIGPLLDQIHKTIDQANETLKKVDGMIGENQRRRSRFGHQTCGKSLDNVTAITAQLQNCSTTTMTTLTNS